MLRSLLVGLLALSVAPACKGGNDAPAVQPGVAAGKVMVVEGKVTATRAGAPRELTAGAEISGDDVIETSEGASVSIWLSHNNATWTLGAGKKGKVGESAAWTAAKVDQRPSGVDEATVAAGRHAEKSAADTAASATDGKGASRDEVAPAEATKRAADPAAVPPPVRGGIRPGGPAKAAQGPGGPGAASDGTAPRTAIAQPVKEAPAMSPAPPPAAASPTPPPMQEPVAQRPAATPQKKAIAPSAGDGGGGGGADKDSKESRALDDGIANERKVPAITLASLVPDQKAAMAKCLETSTLDVHIIVKAHVVTIKSVGASATANKCLATFAPKFKTSGDDTFDVTLTK
ncbi:hypothetical protein BH11MYX2_BH11MYX2_03480 [soil metagenome]